MRSGKDELRRVAGSIRMLSRRLQVQIDSRIQKDRSAILLPSARFDFRSHGGRVSIGRETMVGCTCVFESSQGAIEIGDRSYIGAGTNLISREEIKIGCDVTIAWGCVIYDHNSHSFDWSDRAKDIERQNAAFRAGVPLISTKDWSTVRSRPIRIKDKSWVGFNSIILSGVTIGEGAIVGAGSVVRTDVPDWSIAVGNPAVVVKRVRQRSTSE